MRRRSLLERVEGKSTFTLQSVVLEYVIDQLVEDISAEIARGEPVLLVEQPLIKSQAKDYVRQSQEDYHAQMKDKQVKALKRKARQLGLEVTDKKSGGGATAETASTPG